MENVNIYEGFRNLVMKNIPLDKAKKICYTESLKKCDMMVSYETETETVIYLNGESKSHKRKV